MKKFLTFLLITASVLVYGQTQPEMVFVKGGTFNMGNPHTDRLRAGNSDERPVHRVRLNDFYIGKYEITVAQYREFVMDRSASNEFARFGVASRMPSPPDSVFWQGHPDSRAYWRGQTTDWWGWQNNFPMFHVTWYDAIAYCNWLSEKSGLEKCYTVEEDGNIKCDFSKNGYRLPTEAEWEYAAKGGGKSKNYRFSGSNNFNDVAWIDDNTFLSSPKPVGTKNANEIGIHDMSGNVWEWCYDYYSPFFYGNSPVDNPVNEQPTGYRVLRGGSWHYEINYATVYSRDGPKPGYTNYNYGFRVVRSK